MQNAILLQQLFVQIGAVFFIPGFWFVLMVLSVQIGVRQWQNQRILWKQKQASQWLPVFLLSVLQKLLFTVLAGICGGIFASVLLLVVGITVNVMVMGLIWFVSLLLFGVRRRFVCFAYAGGVVTVFFSLLGISPADCRQLLMMVAVFHFTEALLVRASGTLQSMPVYLRDKKGKTTTGVHLQMTWPLPLALSHTAEAGTILQNGCYVMPDWWPLFSMVSSAGENGVIYQLVPMVAAISYSDMVLSGSQNTMQISKKTVQCGSGLLLCYSLILCGLVLFSRTAPLLLPLAAVFSVIGHEGMLFLGQRYMHKYVHMRKE